MVDTLIFMYTGSFPPTGQRAPTITSPLGIQVNGQDGLQNINLLANTLYSASISASDPNGYQLGYQWMILPIPSGGPTDQITYVPIGVGGVWPIVSQDSQGNCMFRTPSTLGQYRLAVWVYNMYNINGAGVAYKYAYHNAPFNVSLAPSAYTYGVTADAYIQGPQTAGSAANNYASAQSTYGSAQILLGNSYAYTKNVTFYPYLYFNYGASAFPPTASNPPKQVLLNVFSISGQTVRACACIPPAR